MSTVVLAHFLSSALLKKEGKEKFLWFQISHFMVFVLFPNTTAVMYCYCGYVSVNASHLL